MPHDGDKAVEAVTVLCPGAEGLHARLDVVNRHRRVCKRRKERVSTGRRKREAGGHAQTVIRPASAPVANVVVADNFPEAGLSVSSATDWSMANDVNRTAELDACLRIVGPSPR